MVKFEGFGQNNEVDSCSLVALAAMSRVCRKRTWLQKVRKNNSTILKQVVLVYFLATVCIVPPKNPKRVYSCINGYVTMCAFLYF